MRDKAVTLQVRGFRKAASMRVVGGEDGQKRKDGAAKITEMYS